MEPPGQGWDARSGPQLGGVRRCARRRGTAVGVNPAPWPLESHREPPVPRGQRGHLHAASQPPALDPQVGTHTQPSPLQGFDGDEGFPRSCLCPLAAAEQPDSAAKARPFRCRAGSALGRAHGSLCLPGWSPPRQLAASPRERSAPHRHSPPPSPGRESEWCVLTFPRSPTAPGLSP